MKLFVFFSSVASHWPVVEFYWFCCCSFVSLDFLYFCVVAYFFFFQIKSTLPLLYTVFSFFLDNQRYGRFDHEDWCTHKVRVQSQCCFGGTDHKLSYNRQINIQSCSLFLVISLCPFNSLHLAHGTLTEERLIQINQMPALTCL